MYNLILPYKTRFNPELPEDAIKEWERKEAEKQKDEYLEDGFYAFDSGSGFLGFAWEARIGIKIIKKNDKKIKYVDNISYELDVPRNIENQDQKMRNKWLKEEINKEVDRRKNQYKGLKYLEDPTILDKYKKSEGNKIKLKVRKITPADEDYIC